MGKLRDALQRLLGGAAPLRLAPPPATSEEPRPCLLADEPRFHPARQICWGCGRVLVNGQDVWPSSGLFFCCEVCRTRYQVAARHALAKRMGLDPERKPHR